MRLYRQVSQQLNLQNSDDSSTQHTIIELPQAWQKEPDRCKIVGTVLMDLSKVYGCLVQDLLVAKLEAYGLDMASLSLV